MKKLFIIFLLIPFGLTGQVEFFTQQNSVSVPDYLQVYLDEGTNEGCSLPSAGNQDEIQVIIDSLYLTGAWNQLEGFYIFLNDGSECMAKINLINPGSYTITEVGTVGWSASLGADITTSNLNYYDSNFNPSTNATILTTTSANYGIAQSGLQINARFYSFGANGGTYDIALLQRRVTTARYIYYSNHKNGTTTLSHSNTGIYSDHNIMMNIGGSSSSETTFYINGSLETTGSTAPLGLPNANILFSSAYGSSAGIGYMHFAWFGGELTSDQIQTLSNTINEYVSNF